MLPVSLLVEGSIGETFQTACKLCDFIFFGCWQKIILLSKVGGWGLVVVNWREALKVEKCGFARKHFMVGKYRGLQSVLDSWPDPQNCSHFLLPPGLTGFLSTPLFPQYLASKLTFFSQYLSLSNLIGPLFCEPVITPIMIIIVSFLLLLAELDCTMYCLFAGFHNGLDGWIQKGLDWGPQKGQTWSARADNIVKFLSGQFESCTISAGLRISAKRKVWKPFSDSVSAPNPNPVLCSKLLLLWSKSLFLSGAHCW